MAFKLKKNFGEQDGPVNNPNFASKDKLPQIGAKRNNMVIDVDYDSDAARHADVTADIPD